MVVFILEFGLTFGLYCIHPFLGTIYLVIWASLIIGRHMRRG